MEENLEYSGIGKRNRYIFYQEYNRLCVFVEDSKKEYIYENIFERLLHGREIPMIFPLNGKKDVK